MCMVHRVTSVTLVTLLAFAVPQLPADASSSAAGARHTAAAHPRHHHHHKLTPKQRYRHFHPRLIRAARIAVHQRGDRYQWGAEGPKRFDCSGLVYYAYREAGFRHIPRAASQQYHAVRHIRKSQLRRGDLIFFRQHRRVYHVAIFLYWKHGRRVFVHSPNSRGRVRKEVPWTGAWRAGTTRPAHPRADAR